MTVTVRADSAWFDGVTGLTADKVLAIPAAQVTGDMVLPVAGWKDFSITALISGYTELTEFADGAVVTGNGTGSMKVGAWYKEATSDPEADPTLDFSTTVNLLGEAKVFVAQKTLAAWDTPTFVTAAWPSSASATVSASSTITVPSGSLVVCMFASRDDGTFSGQDITDAGGLVTWNSGTTAPAGGTSASTTTGNDMSIMVVYRTVTTGAAGVTLRLTATLAAAETGTLLWVVLNDSTPPVRVPRFTPYPQILAH